MKADCENFILQLQEHTEIVPDEACKEHLASCENCRRLLENHDRSFGRLKNDLMLSVPVKEAILTKVQKRIAEEKSLKSSSSDFSLSAWLHSWRLQVAFIALLAVIVAGFWHFDHFGPDDTMQLSGSAVILKNFKKVVLENTRISLNPGEKITLLNGQMDLCWPNSERVSIEGMLDFAVQERNIAAKSGQATLSFLPATSGYMITTRLMQVKILGTTVMLELNDSSDSISVIEGKVEWSLHDGTRKGTAGAGTRIVVKADLNGQKVSEEVCPTDMPRYNPNQLLEMNGGLGARKTGNAWTPLEEN